MIPALAKDITLPLVLNAESSIAVNLLLKIAANSKAATLIENQKINKDLLDQLSNVVAKTVFAQSDDSLAKIIDSVYEAAIEKLESTEANPDATKVVEIVKEIVKAAKTEGLSASTKTILADSAENTSSSTTNAGAEDITSPAAGSFVDSNPVKATSFTLNWTRGQDDVTASELLQYFVCSGPNLSAIDTVSKCKVSTVELNYTANVLSLSLSGKTPATTYFYNVIVRDAANLETIYAGKSQTTNSALTATFTFDSTSDYTYDENIEVVGGKVALARENMTDDDNSVTGFAGGIHSNTVFDSNNNTVKISTGVSGFPTASNLFYNMTDLELLYRMEESSGNLSDSSPNGRTGIPTGVTYGAAGRFNNSVTFASTNSVSVQDEVDLNIGVASKLSYAIWFKTSSGSGTQSLLDKRINGTWRGYHLFLSNGVLAFQINDNSVHAFGPYGTDYRDGKWHQVVWTIDRPNNVASIYLDGIPLNQNIDISAASGDVINSENLLVGGHATGSYSFQGQLDDIALFSRVLSEEEVFQISESSNFISASFRSRVLGSGASRAWSTISWQPNVPFQKELPCSQSVETAYNSGNIDMSTSVLYLKFNENSWAGNANEVLDCAGTNHGKSVNGATTTTGKFKRAGSFSGGENVEIANTAPFDFEVTDAFSFSAWVNTTYSAGHHDILAKYVAPRGYLFSLVNGRNLSADIVAAGASTMIKKTDDRILNDGKWHHVVMTYDGSSDHSGMKLYVDGTQSAGVTSSGNGLIDSDVISNGTKLLIGNRSDGGLPFHGKIDEVAIFSKELTATKVQSIYRRGLDEVVFQVRSCTDVVCSSNPPFVGPAALASDVYSEKLNSSLEHRVFLCPDIRIAVTSSIK